MARFHDIFRLAVFSFAFVLALAQAAWASGISIIRDAEIENTIRSFATPIFQAAGLEPSAVRIRLVNDRGLNAFVAGGQNLFINTGLIVRTEHPGQLIGVIAHETGHIAGGHLARTREAIREASTIGTIAAILGGVVAAGAGRGDALGAGIVGGQTIGLKTFMNYSRVQEYSADQAALRYMEAAGWSSRGMVEFMQVLETQELWSPDRQDPYMRSHPFSRDRVDAMLDHLTRSRYTDMPFPPEFDVMHRRMKAKLAAFLDRPAQTLRRVKPDDPALESRYSRAIAHFKNIELDKALVLIDGLIQDYPEDPYFHELKGQMLFESGRGGEALQFYAEAVRLLPSSGLLRLDLARVLIETEKPENLEAAIGHIQAALHQERESPFAWRQLGIAYGRQGEEGMSAVSLAEEALLKGDLDIARFQAGKAEKLLPTGSRGWLQAQDILAASQGAKGN